MQNAKKEFLDSLVAHMEQPECDEHEKELFYILTLLFKIDKDFRMFLGLFLSIYKAARLRRHGAMELSRGLTELGLKVGAISQEKADEIYALLDIKEKINANG